MTSEGDQNKARARTVADAMMRVDAPDPAHENPICLAVQLTASII